MDLADFKHNTSCGLQMACLGGVWMSIANGCLGMRDYDGGLQFNPQCPPEWNSYELDILYRGSRIHIFVDKEHAEFTLTDGEPVRFFFDGKEYTLDSKRSIDI